MLLGEPISQPPRTTAAAEMENGAADSPTVHNEGQPALGPTMPPTHTPAP